MTDGRPAWPAVQFADEFDAAALDTSVWVPHYPPAWSSPSGERGRIRGPGLVTAPAHPGGPPRLVRGRPRAPRSACPVSSPVVVRTRRKHQASSRSGPARPSARSSRHSGAGRRRRAGSGCAPGPWCRRGRWSRSGWSASKRSWSAVRRSASWRRSATPSSPVSSAIGMGLHPFRDSEVREDFEAVRLPLDLAEFHTYACDWSSDRVDYLVDGTLVRRVQGPPRYPLQLMLAVFDFPTVRSAGTTSWSRSSSSTGSAATGTPRGLRRTGDSAR